MRRLLVAILALGVCASLPARADNPPQPDLLSVGVGYMNFDKSEPKTNSADFRLEYRFGYNLLGGGEFAVHPLLGYETTSRNLQYGLGGLGLDWKFAPHGIFTWSEALGYLDSGDQRTLGGTFQFRSQAEIGYRFDNDMRITAEFSHISDAKLTRVNPGAEIVGMYVHVPVGLIVGSITK